MSFPIFASSANGDNTTPYAKMSGINRLLKSFRGTIFVSKSILGKVTFPKVDSYIFIYLLSHSNYSRQYKNVEWRILFFCIKQIIKRSQDLILNSLAYAWIFLKSLRNDTSSSTIARRASILMRSCCIESRWRTVTVPSSKVWWSTVTQNGVPIASWRR